MKTYAVNYNGGAGGHFLQELILWCETQDTLILTYPKANAHFIVDNWVTNNLDGVTALSEYHTLKSNSPYNFIITYGGTVDSVNTMYQRDLENFRMINVVIDNPFEMSLCEYNHFYKNQLHEFKFNGIDYGLFPHYKNLMSRHTSNEILMPDWGKVSTEDMSEILLAQGIKMYKENMIAGHGAAAGAMAVKNSVIYKMLKESPHLELTVTDVMENDEKVLETISTLVGKPITSAMQYNCKKYVQAQQQLRKKFPAYDRIKELYSRMEVENITV